MDVRSIQSSPQSLPNRTGNILPRRGAVNEGQSGPVVARQQTEQQSVLSSDEQQFFEELYPGMSNEIRGHQAYSFTGAERKSAPLGTMVDRKG